MAANEDTNKAVQDSLSRETLEMWSSEMKSSQLHVGSLEGEVVDTKAPLEGSEEDAREELGLLLGRVKLAVASLRYMRSQARILADPGLSHLSFSNEQLELEDDSLLSEVDKGISLLTFHNSSEGTLAGTSKNKDPLVIDDGSHSWKMLESIQMVTNVLESLVKRVTTAESETSFQKERVNISEEEIRMKTIQIENLSLRLEEMKQFVGGTNTAVNEMRDMIEDLVEVSRRQEEKAVENEEELRRVKTEYESLQSYVRTLTNVRETLLSSNQQSQTTGSLFERLVAKSTQLEGEKAQKEVEVQKLMVENIKLTSLLDKKEAQLLALNEQCKVMALNASNI